MTTSPGYVPLVVAFVALLVGLIGAGKIIAAILQKSRADAREALWERARLAIAMSQSSKPGERELGADMVGLLLEQGRLSREDAQVLELALGHALAEGTLEDAADDEVAAVTALQERGAPGTRAALDSGPPAADHGRGPGGTHG